MRGGPDESVLNWSIRAVWKGRNSGMESRWL